jgi:hypothetical protein
VNIGEPVTLPRTRDRSVAMDQAGQAGPGLGSFVAGEPRNFTPGAVDLGTPDAAGVVADAMAREQNYAPDGAGDQIGDAVNVATQNRFTSASSHADVPDLSG